MCDYDVCLRLWTAGYVLGNSDLVVCGLVFLGHLVCVVQHVQTQLNCETIYIGVQCQSRQPNQSCQLGAGLVHEGLCPPDCPVNLLTYALTLIPQSHSCTRRWTTS